MPMSYSAVLSIRFLSLGFWSLQLETICSVCLGLLETCASNLHNMRGKEGIHILEESYDTLATLG